MADRNAEDRKPEDSKVEDRKADETDPIAELNRILLATDLSSATPTGPSIITPEPASGSRLEGDEGKLNVNEERPPRFPWPRFINELDRLIIGYEDRIREIQETPSTSQITPEDHIQTNRILKFQARLEKLQYWRPRWKDGSDHMLHDEDIEDAIAKLDATLAEEWKFFNENP